MTMEDGRPRPSGNNFVGKNCRPADRFFIWLPQVTELRLHMNSGLSTINAGVNREREPVEGLPCGN